MLRYLPFALFLAACSGKEDDSGTPTGTDDTGTTDGVSCADYCAEYVANCSGDASNTYADQADCESTRGSFTQGNAGYTSGTTLECRMYHAEASASDAATHCPHAAETPTAACI